MDIIVAKNIKKLREEHSLTQEAVAEALGISAIAVYKWEAGRLPVDYRMLKRIAEFYEVPVDTLLADDNEEESPNAASDQVSFKCKVCGGDLIYDYLNCASRCANCGNKWAIAELYPKFSRVIATISKASDILNTKSAPSAADEAKLLFKQAITELEKNNDAVSAELIKICKEGIEKTKQLEIYCRGKYFFDHRSYKSALTELEKVSGFRDADEMIKRCKRQPKK